jgi:hypothetical protein
MDRGKKHDVAEAMAVSQIALENLQAAAGAWKPNTPVLQAMQQAMQKDAGLAALMVDLLATLDDCSQQSRCRVDAIRACINQMLD